MQKPFTQLNRFTRSFNNGFTLIELIIGAAVSFTILAVTLGLIVEQRRVFLGDQTKIDFGQNLRAASDIVGTDIKQAGERLEDDSPLPVVQVFSGASSTDPDTIILQRKLISDVLEICVDIEKDDKSITIAREGDSCGTQFLDTKGGGAPGVGDRVTDSLNQFKEYRCDFESGNTTCSRGEDDSVDSSTSISSIDDCDSECVVAYIHNPSDDRGEFFLYVDEVYEGAEGSTENKLKVIPLSSDGEFVDKHKVSDNPQIYILEEKKYALCDGVLQLTINRVPAYDADCPYPTESPQPIRLVDGLQKFQIRLQKSDGSWVDSFNTNLASPTPFTEVRSIEMNLETTQDPKLNTATKTLELSTEFFPRNVLSK